MFCACSTAYDGAAPNTHTCPVCLGLPGRPADDQPGGGRARPRDRARDRRDDPDATRWDRKNYFYPDLPKGYQISQYDLPLAAAGSLTFDTSDGPFDGPDHAGRISRRTRPSSSTPTADGRRGEPRRLQPLGCAAHGDRHRARRPHGRAGAPLRRGAAAAAAGDRRVGCRHGARPDAGRGQRLAAAARHGARSGRGSRSRT